MARPRNSRRSKVAEAPAAVSEAAAAAIQGDLYSLTPWGVLGWAWATTPAGRSVEVEAVLDATVIGRTTVADRGGGEGRCAFSIGFHEPVTGATPPAIHLRHDGQLATIQRESWSVLEGFVDEATVWGVTGWAWIPADPAASVAVEVHVRDRLVGRSLADRLRPDIGGSGRGTGLYGFVLPFDAPVQPDDVLACTAVAPDGTRAALPCAAMSEVVGFVDELTRHGATGWAWRPETPGTSLAVEAVLDGTVIGQGTADLLLKHLQGSGRGTGRYGFELRFDQPVRGGTAPLLRARVGDRVFPLLGVTAFNPAEAQPEPPREETPVIGEGAVDHLTRHSVSGWAWDPQAPDAAIAIEAVADRRLVGSTRAEQLREDLAYWGKGTGRYGFTLFFKDPLTGPTPPRIFGRTAAGLFELKGGEAFAGKATPQEGGRETAQPEADKAEAAVEGSVDYLTRSGASGWAWRPEAPGAAVTVEAVLGGKIVGTAMADHLREDLAHWGKGTGRYGFTLSFEAALTGPEAPLFRVMAADVTAVLPAPPWPEEAGAVQEAAAAAPLVEGHVDRLTRWEATGWAWIPSRPEARVEIRAILDGRIIGRAVAEELRQDLADGGKGTGEYGYHMVFDTPILGDATPEFLPYVPAAGPLEGTPDLPPTSSAELAERSRGTTEMLLADHARFTGAGLAFEEFDPTILADAEPADGAPAPWLIAFYLPQFHAITANDEFWGKGFTEWRQLPRGISRYPGHYQPRTPRDLGFYNLLDTAALEAQFALAKAAGITAFAYYYYWFNGTRVLEKPLDSLMASAVEVPFMIIWANENWTRTWDGSESSILLRQDYRKEDDKALVDDLARHFNDPRYLRIAGRPFFVIYNPGNIPDVAKAVARWRKLLRTRHGLYPLVFMAQTFGMRDPAAYGLDGAMEFPPHKLTDTLPGRRTPDAYSPSFRGRVIDYEDFVSTSFAEEVPSFPLVKTAVPSWDNESRRPGRGLSLEGASPRKYQAWLQGLLVKAAKHPVLGQPMVAVNAWNEWAEGAYLEPDVHFGAAYLNATARARRTAASLLDPGAARPRVSVVFPNYNHEAFIVERITSVLNQTVPPDEIIFLDDCSTDGSVALAQAVLEASGVPFRMMLNTENSGGVFRQWIKGLDLARHELVWIAETDDSVHPDFLLHILPAFEQESVRATFGHIRYMEPDGRKIDDLEGYFDDLRDFSWTASATVPAFRAFARDFTVKNVIPNASGLVFRKPVLTAAERARLVEYRFAGDWYFYALVLRGGSLAYCRSAESFFRLNRSSASRSAFFTERHLAEHAMVISDLRHLYGIGQDAIDAHAASLARYLQDRSAAELAALLSAPLEGDDRPRPMRICIAAHSFDVGGGEVMPLELANSLRGIGHHVTYLLVEKPRRGQPNLRHRLHPDVPVVFWDDMKADFGGFLADHGIEVLNSHNVSLDYRLALADQAIAIPYVASLHGGYETVPGLLTPGFFDYVGRTVTSWLFLSEKNLDALRQHGVEAEKFKRSFNAVPDFTGEWVDRDAFRAEHGIPPDAFVLVQCSRAIEEKGWGVAVDVVAAAAKRTERPLHLVLIGEGPAAVRLRKAPAASMRHVTLLGQVDTPIRFFRCCDAALFPSTFSGETFPLFLLEAFMAGLPVITTDIGEIKEILGADESRRAGVAVAHDAGRRSIVGAMTKELERIVNDPKAFRRLCSNAQDTSARFSAAELANFYVDEFRRVSFPAGTRLLQQPEQV